MNHAHNTKKHQITAVFVLFRVISWLVSPSFFTAIQYN